MQIKAAVVRERSGPFAIETLELCEPRPDELIVRIVSGWSERFDAKRAAALGFKAEASFDDIIRAHIDDELGGKIVN